MKYVFNESDTSNVVHREWLNHVSIQVREFDSECEINCWCKILDTELIATRTIASGTSHEEMIEYAHRVGAMLDENVEVFILVHDSYICELLDRHSDILTTHANDVNAALDAGGIEMLKTDLLSNYVDPLEIVSYVKGFIKHLHAKIADEKRQDDAA